MSLLILRNAKHFAALYIMMYKLSFHQHAERMLLFTRALKDKTGRKKEPFIVDSTMKVYRLQSGN